jgi:hypothetical protein
VRPVGGPRRRFETTTPAAKEAEADRGRRGRGAKQLDFDLALPDDGLRLREGTWRKEAAVKSRGQPAGLKKKMKKTQFFRIISCFSFENKLNGF